MDDHLSRALDRVQANTKSVHSWNKPERGANKRKRRERSIHETLDRGTSIELDAEILQRNHLLTTTVREDSLISDCYRLLRTRIWQTMKPRGWNKLGITSPSAKEGKSLTSANLAIIASRDASRKIVLIDADMRRPSLFENFGIEASAGLSDYLSGNADLEDVIYRPSMMPNLYILPTQVASDKLMEESLGGQHIQQLLEDLSSNDVMTIVDLPPALVADDVLSLSPYLDSLLIVVRAGQSNSKELKNTTDLLSEVNILGTVLNDSAEAGRDTHGYYYAR